MPNQMPHVTTITAAMATNSAVGRAERPAPTWFGVRLRGWSVFATLLESLDNVVAVQALAGRWGYHRPNHGGCRPNRAGNQMSIHKHF